MATAPVDLGDYLKVLQPVSRKRQATTTQLSELTQHELSSSESLNAVRDQHHREYVRNADPQPCPRPVSQETGVGPGICVLISPPQGFLKHENCYSKNELRVKNETVCTYQNFKCKKFLLLPNLPTIPNFCIYTNFLLIYIF